MHEVKPGQLVTISHVTSDLVARFPPLGKIVSGPEGVQVQSAPGGLWWSRVLGSLMRSLATRSSLRLRWCRRCVLESPDRSPSRRPALVKPIAWWRVGPRQPSSTEPSRRTCRRQLRRQPDGGTLGTLPFAVVTSFELQPRPRPGNRDPRRTKRRSSAAEFNAAAGVTASILPKVAGSQ